MISFASDNYSGIHPNILTAISHANHGHAPAYGYDSHSQTLEQLIKARFGTQATCYPIFNGTGANVIALSALTPRFGAVLCADTAHIHNDESSAPECMGGVKLLPIATTDGKLTPELIQKELHRLGNEHSAQPAVVYLSLTTELGTCYGLDELQAIVNVAHGSGLAVYIDGARLANACAYLGCTLADIANTGVDMLSLGGTKNGMMLGECLVVLNPKYDPAIKYLRKNHMQLGSKLRFISAQFIAWLDNDLWLELATHSNAMAQRLYQGLKDLDGVTITQAVQSNAVFVILPKAVKDELQAHYHFYDWNVATGEVRLMSSFDTTPEQVDEFIAMAKRLLVTA